LRTLSLIDSFYSHYNQISKIIQKSELYKDFNIYNEEISSFQQLKNYLFVSKFQNDTGRVYFQSDKFTLNFNFEEFYKVFYESLYKDLMKLENINKQESVVNIISNYNNKKVNIRYEYFELENNFLFNYFYYLNNYFEIRPKEEIFLFDKICKINSIPTIHSNSVSDFIESEFLNFSKQDIDNIIIYSLINLFLIAIGENCTQIYSSMKEILYLIKGKNIYIRKYLELISNTFVDPRFSSGNCL